MYHRIGDEAEFPSTSVSKEQFEAHISLLEQQMHDTFDSALRLATHPAPPQPAEEGAPAEPRPTLELLKSWTQPRLLFKGEAVLLKPRDEPVVDLDA